MGVVVRQSGEPEVTVRMTVSADQAESERIPDKSRCLRQSSVAKRLETEKARRLPRVKERTIKSLQDLLADCDSGNLEEEVYRTSLAMDTAAAAAAVSAAKSHNKSDKVKTKRPARKKKAVKRLSASNERWTNYSQRFLKQKFETDNTKLCQDNLQAPSTPSSSPSASPRDVNEISLHISLLDSGNLQQNVDNGQLLYIFQVDNMRD